MIRTKHILSALLGVIMATEVATAQNNTNSPYTRYGLGDLAEQGFGNSRAMGGLAIGLRDKYHINPVNQASYTSIDSLTFLFDAGLTLQNMNVSDGTVKLNAKNSSFDYLAMQFRLRPWIAMSIGLLPYSNVGYSLSDSQTTESGLTYSRSYTGDGGFHQLYAGLGVKLHENLSVGANFSYLWGDITRMRDVYYPETTSSYYYQQTTTLSASDYKLDFGLQYTQPLTEKKRITIGAVYSPQKRLNNDYSVETRTSYINTVDYDAKLKLPHSFGVGLTYQYADNLTVGADYSLQKWSKVNSSLGTGGEDIWTEFSETFAYKDRSKISVGAEYLPDAVSRSYFGRIRYRLGAYYTSPYYKVNGASAASEYGITAGLGLPMRSYQSRSVLNIGAQFVRVKGKNAGLIDETVFRVNIGITFNERWFTKSKVK